MGLTTNSLVLKINQDKYRKKKQEMKWFSIFVSITFKRNLITRQAAALIQALQAHGTSFGDIAQELNKNGFKTAQEKEFDTEMVKAVFDRMADIEQINREINCN